MKVVGKRYIITVEEETMTIEPYNTQRRKRKLSFDCTGSFLEHIDEPENKEMIYTNAKGCVGACLNLLLEDK